MTEASSADPARIIWQQVFWQVPFLESAAMALLRHLAAQRHAPRLILEARADSSGVQYVIGSQARHASSVRRAIEQLATGSIVTKFPSDEREDVDTARAIRLSTDRRPLVAFDPAASARSVLTALTAVAPREELVLQVVLAERRTPRPAPPAPPSTTQSTTAKLVRGIDRTPTSEERSALGAKLAQHAFAATVRIGATATTAQRRRTLLLGVASALGTADAPGVNLTLGTAKAEKFNRGETTAWWLGRAQTWNVAEVSHVLGWPITGPHDPPLPGQPAQHPRPLRPLRIAEDGDRIVAEATAPGASGQLGYSITDAMRHTWILGPNGVGKSALMLSLICQDMAAGRGVVVIEPKDLVADILARIPTERRDDVVVLDPLDPEPVGINPLAGSRGQRWQVTADTLYGMFRALYGDGLGPRSADILRNALEVLARRDDASLVMLPLLLSNPGVRRSLTQHAMRDDPFAAGPFWSWFDSLSPDAAARVVGPLSNKVRPLLSPTLRAVLSQRRPRFNVREVLSDKKILLVPLHAGTLGPENAQLLAAVVIGELWQAIRERVTIPETERAPVSIYIDEVQDYLRLPTDLADALATARSLRAGFHLAHQFRTQLPPAMLAAVEANARSRILFQVGATDARAMAAGQSLLAPEDFSALGKYEIYAQLVRDNTVQPWASGRTLPPPPRCSDPKDIRAKSRSRYGQPLSDIEAGFAELLNPPSERVSNRRRRSNPEPASDSAHGSDHVDDHDDTAASSRRTRARRVPDGRPNGDTRADDAADDASSARARRGGMSS